MTMDRSELDHSVWNQWVFPAIRKLIEVGYITLEVEGVENVPKEGPVVFVDNHGGWFPIDAFMLNMVVADHVGEQRIPHTATLDLALNSPVLGPFLKKLGGLPSSQFRDPRTLPDDVESYAMFPEGEMGPCRPFYDAYSMGEWRRGFVRLALAKKAQVVPVAVIGNEECLPVAGEFSLLKRWLGTGVPIPLSVLPLPSRWKISFLPPVDLSGYDDSTAADSEFCRQVAADVRDRVQTRLDEETANRPIRLALSSMRVLGQWARNSVVEQASKTVIDAAQMMIEAAEALREAERARASSEESD